MIQEASQPVQCDCCQLPAAEIVGGTLVIRSKHHGDRHTTVLSLDFIRRQLERSTVESNVVISPV